MILYLNFDGVLHPDRLVYVKGLTPSLVATGHSPFEHAGFLAEILEPYDDIELVLNTWWTFFVGVDLTLELLPLELASRVVDATLALSSRYDSLPSRCKEAEKHIASKNKQQTLLLDNSNARYSWDLVPYMLLLDPTEGMASMAARRALARKIEMSLAPLN